MLSVSKRFLLILFSTLMSIFLIANLYIFVNNPTDVVDNTRYFGFSSFLRFLDDFKSLPSLDENNMLYLPQIFQSLYDDTIGLFVDLQVFKTGNVWEILTAVVKLLELFVLPINVIKDLCLLLASMVADLVVILGNFFKLISGGYSQIYRSIVL